MKNNLKPGQNVWLIITKGRVHAYSCRARRDAVVSRLARRLGVSFMRLMLSTDDFEVVSAEVKS